MSIFTRGKLVDTGGLRANKLGRQYAPTKVMAVEENKSIFSTAPEYYQYMMEIWHRHVEQAGYASPSTVQIFDDYDLKNLDAICDGSYFSVNEDTVHIDNWNVNEDHLFHKHPEFGVVPEMIADTDAELEWTVRDRRCSLCGDEIPDNIWLIHKMYQL